MKIVIWIFFNRLHPPASQQKELVIRELLIFKHYQMDPKNIKCNLQWWGIWGKHETMFLTIGFLAHQILCFVGAQIETFFFFH
jgi:hypothetical protein